MFVRNFLFVTSEPSPESCGHDVYVCICVCVCVRVGDIRKFDKLPCLLANTVSPDSTFFGRDLSHIT